MEEALRKVRREESCLAKAWMMHSSHIILGRGASCVAEALMEDSSPWLRL